MAWQLRNGSGPYFYLSKRVNGRVVNRYIGGGVAGELAAALILLGRAERRLAAARRREAMSREQSLLAPLEELCQFTELVAKAALLAAGFHRHERGRWRQRRQAIPDRARVG
jgi:hypothetical protein